MVRWPIGLGLLLAASCGGRSHVPGGGDEDAATERDAAVPRDAATHDDGSVEAPDAAAPVCDCAARVPVGMFHECTPPLEVGCSVQTCTPGGDECPEGHTCEDCAAAACCECAACVPACIHTSGVPHEPLPEYLALGTSYGPADEVAETTVRGAPFYVGALGYTVRLGDGTELAQTGGGVCSIRVTLPARPAGTIQPIWVSQYGFGEPWVLAGFYTWTDRGDPPACVQPGLPCDDGAWPCCETPDVPMSCDAGRCRRE